MNEYIINSRLDTDWYKFTMGQFVLHRYPDIPVKYEFINRTKAVELPKYIDEKDIRRELDHVMELKVPTDEMNFLASLKNSKGEVILKDDFLKFFKNHALPPYKLENIGHTYRLEFPGPWKTAIWWEIPALAIITNLYNKAVLSKRDRIDQLAHYATGKFKLRMKIAKLLVFLETLPPENTVRIMEFGTRRRDSYDWQDFVVRFISKALQKWFIGTSNVKLAMKHGLTPCGTQAHELSSALYGIFYNSENPAEKAIKTVLNEWWDEYGYDFSIDLPDTFGTDYFLQNMTKEQAVQRKGLRQDSGDPFVFTENKAIPFYQKFGIDAREKTNVFSDGLDEEKIIALASKFSSRIQCTFGPGSNFTNDLTVNPLSLVIKLTEANGHPTVKLSDNIAKAVGEPAEIERAKKLVEYKNEFNQQPIY